MPKTLTDADVAAATDGVLDEYVSKTISIDHMALTPHNGHTVIKQVYSTETAVEALVAQLKYFGLSDQLERPGVHRILSQAADKAAVLVLKVPEHGQHNGFTQVIVDAALWSDPETHDKINPAGTVLGLDAALMALALDLQAQGTKENPGELVFAFITD